MDASPDLDRLSWEVAGDPVFSDVARSGDVPIDHDADHTARVDVDGLSPATTYWYRFRSGSHSSPVGRTRTLPDTGTEGVRLATVCCARYAAAPLTVYRALAECDVDLVVHLGDSIYEDGDDSGPRRHDPPHATVTLDDYRRRHAQIRADPDARALYQRHPMVVIWDDHDLADNAWHGGAKRHDPARDGPWDDRVEAATRAHDEWNPARLTDPDNRRLRWRSLVLGDLAELILLDTRYFGRDEQADAESARPLHDPDRSMLGDEQRQWAHGRVADTSRLWALLASAVVMNPMMLPAPRLVKTQRAVSSGFGVLDGQLLRTDQWDGYPAERDKLITVMDRRGGGVVVLSGDVHSSWAFEGPCTADGRRVAVEFTCPATASIPMGREISVGGGFLEELVEALPRVKYAELLNHGFTTVDITADTVCTTWWLVDPEDPEARRRGGASWSVRRDRPGELVEVECPDGNGDIISFRPPADADADLDPVDLPERPPDIGRRRARREQLVRASAVTAAVIAEHLARRVRRRPDA